MTVRPLLPLALLVPALLGCRGSTVPSPAGDVAASQAEASRRTGRDLSAPWAPPTADAATPDEVADLLRRPLTEESAVRIAILNNRKVRAAYEDLGVARAELVQAGLLANPVFGASARLFHEGTEVELGISKSLLDVFLRPLRRCVAQADLEAAQASVARTLVRLVADVRRACVRARAAERVAALRKDVAASTAAARDLMRKLHDAGNETDPRLTAAEIAAERASMEQDDAISAARLAREPLNVLLGLRSGAPEWTLAGDLGDTVDAVATPADVEARAVAASLDRLEGEARIESAARAAGLVRRRSGFTIFEVGAEGMRDAADGTWGVGPSVTASLPLFDQGQAQVAVARATFRRRVAEAAALEVEIRSAARHLEEHARRTRERARRHHDVYLPLRARLVREVVQYYNAMQIGAFEVLEAKQRETDARREHVEALEEAWLARIDLEELLAGALNREPTAHAPMMPREEPPTPQGGH